jgi:hypothetical protein
LIWWAPQRWKNAGVTGIMIGCFTAFFRASEYCKYRILVGKSLGKCPHTKPSK